VESGAKPLRPNYGDDARSEVIVDDNDNIYLAAQTRSSNFLTTANAFQKTFGGVQDGVVLKLSPDVSNVLFSSFLGGKTEDAAFVLALHPQNNNIYVAGATTSTDFPGVNNGAVMQNTFAGGVSDGFVSIISNDGSTLVKSSYFGTNAEDLIFGIQIDKFGFPYIMGTTDRGTWPVINAAFSQAGGRHFISKLNADLNTWQYSTVFGPPNNIVPSISPTAFLVDRCENVYVSGWGGGIDITAGYHNAGTRDLTTTPDAEVPNTIGRDGADFYFFVLKKNAASQLYGSMFGQTGGLGDHVDGGTSRFDKQGIIYQAICANCGGSSGSPFQVVFPTTAGAWASSNGALQGRGCNLAAIKIAFNLAGIGTSIRASIEGVVKKSGCIPLQVDFRDTIALAKKYIWHFGDNTADVTTTTPTVSHTYTAIGDYLVRLVAIDSGTCNVADTAYITIRARNDRAVLGFDYLKLTPPCTALNYQFTNTSTATRPFTDTSFIWNMGDNTFYNRKGMNTFIHQYATPGTYNVTLSLADTNYCNYPDSVTQQLRIAINVKAQFTTPASGCYPYTAVFNNTSLGGQQFLWDFGDGTTSTDIYPSHTYAGTGVFNVRLIAIDPTTCNGRDTSAYFAITVSPNPVAAFTYSPTQPIKNTPFNFVNNSTGANSYIWRFGDGEGFTTLKRDTAISHIYNASGTYEVCLITTNEYGCADTACQNVDALIAPLVDVPSAFTPNGDGINDRVRLRGYGINKMVFRIYNRWGAMVYESTSIKDAGWDGRYKGALQPQDVYGYIADIEFSDGKRYQKKGDITLLR
jgi:gliding motility-associated-like protein